jgi:hypothetical protein
MTAMNPFATSVTTLAVSMIFCLWQGYRRDQQRRQRRLRQRVAYMLWVAAWRAD